MFICRECHQDEKRTCTHITSSWGPCEVCKRSRECYDCKAHKRPGGLSATAQLGLSAPSVGPRYHVFLSTLNGRVHARVLKSGALFSEGWVDELIIRMQQDIDRLERRLHEATYREDMGR